MCTRYSATKQKVTFYVNGVQISLALFPLAVFRAVAQFLIVRRHRTR